MIGPADILQGKILIVDDQEANVALLQLILSRAGYTHVTSTQDPSKVCELHLTQHFDLILLDLHMPGMDGFQVMENLKEIETEGYIPVLVITAQPSHKLRALQAGAKDFISKPLDLPEVLARVHNMLEVRLLHLETKRLMEQLQAEKLVAERLLLNALPASIAERLNGRPEVVAGPFMEIVTESYAEVTVLFADLMAFTAFAEGASADVLMGVLDEISSRFEHASAVSNLNRARTIGNAYLASMGLTDLMATHSIEGAKKVLDIIEAVDRFNARGRYQLRLRIGLDTGVEASTFVKRASHTYDL